MTTKLTIQVGAAASALMLLSGCAASRPAQHGRNDIILVGHGVPAADYPKDRLQKYFRSHKSDHAADQHAHDAAMPGHTHPQSERDVLEYEIRNWPRTPQNDPYKFGVEQVARRLEKQTGHRVIVAFNEFCAPTVEDALERAVGEGATRIAVISTMMTPGGGHSEKDIPKSLEAAKTKYPNVEIVYAWPFDPALVAATLEAQLRKFGTD